MSRPWGLAIAAATSVGCGGGSAPAPTQSGCQGSGLFALALERSTIDVGDSIRGTVNARGCGGTTVSTAALQWESSSPAVASIGVDGAIIGEAAGHAQITARLGASATSVPLNVVERPPRGPGGPDTFAVQLFSPTTGMVVDDSVRVLGSVVPQGLPVARVTGRIGAREFTLHVIYVGFSRQELWEARLRVNDLAAGNYKVVVTAFAVSGASASDSVIFERRLLNSGGTGAGASGNKLRVPPATPVKRP